MTDRAQDTEAIRAARELLRELDVTEPESFPFVATRRVREVVVGLVARLEAAERERDGMEHQRDFWEQRYETQHRTVHRMEDEIASLRAALAAAAPGETEQTP